MLEVELELEKTREALAEKNSFIEEPDMSSSETNNIDDSDERLSVMVDKKRARVINHPSIFLFD